MGRFVELPKINNTNYYTFIDDVIKQHSDIVFSGFNVKSKCSVKLNRDAELFLDEDFSENIVKKIAKSLNNREIGNPARFLYDPSISSSTLEYLQETLDLREGDSISGGAYHNLFDLFELPNPIGKELENEVFTPLPHKQLINKTQFLMQLMRKIFFYHFLIKSTITSCAFLTRQQLTLQL